MKNNHLFLDIHAIQILPPSNVNRDDTGSPKTARFGGVTRARVSSQAWKKAMRDYFCKNGQEFRLGIRTKRILNYVILRILEKGISSDRHEAQDKVAAVLENAGYKYSRKKQELDALYFFSNEQIDKLAEFTQNERYIKKYDTDSEKKKIKKEIINLLKEDTIEIDIALFGRMLAGTPLLKEDASSQVAHAISTHEVQTEYDYFIAKDDWVSDDDGAAMIETNEFNSSTLYRYANVAVHEFLHQMKDDKELTARALRLYIEAFAKSMPSGKCNSYANQTFPQALLVILRDDRPISFVGAYENAVKAKNGYTEESVRRLFTEGRKADKFVHTPVASFCLLADDTWYPSEGEAVFTGNKEKEMTELLDDFSNQLVALL